MVTRVITSMKMYMVCRVTSVIAKGAENILRAIFRRRDIVSQLRVTIRLVVRLVVFLICCFLLGMAMKPLLIKGQTGAFKPSIALSNLVLGIALVCRPVQALDNFVSKFTLLTKKHE